jgi:Mg2+ and Co2+ transporter CorA
MGTFASIISNNQNLVMKLLAAITIVLSIPTMIASFYGMNFANIPGKDNPFGFYFYCPGNINPGYHCCVYIPQEEGILGFTM